MKAIIKEKMDGGFTMVREEETNYDIIANNKAIIKAKREENNSLLKECFNEILESIKVLKQNVLYKDYTKIEFKELSKAAILKGKTLSESGVKEYSSTFNIMFNYYTVGLNLPLNDLSKANIITLTRGVNKGIVTKSGVNKDYKKALEAIKTYDKENKISK